METGIISDRANDKRKANTGASNRRRRAYFGYIVQRGSALHFRISVPNQLRQVIGKAEIRLSLGAIAYTEARPKAYLLAARSRMLFEFIANRIMEGLELDIDKVNALMHRVLSWELNYRESMILESYANKDNEYISKGLNEYSKEYSDRIYSSSEIDGSSVFDTLYQSVECKDNKSINVKNEAVRSISAELNCDKELASDMFNVFEDEIRTSENKVGIDVFKARGFFDRVSSLALKHVANKVDGNFSIKDAHEELAQYFPQSGEVQSSVIVGVPQVAYNKVDSISLGEAVEQNIHKLNESKGKINNKHGAKFKAHALIEMSMIIGRELPVSKITVDIIDSYVEKLKHIPIRLSINNIKFDINEFGVTRNSTETLSFDTISKRLSDARRFVNWLKGNRYIDKDHSDMLNKRINEGINECESHIERNGGSQTRAYNIDELSKLFCADAYLKWTGRRADYFWPPIIALFTGMRMGEIMTLRCKDIKCTPELLDYHVQRKSTWREKPIDGLYYFDLTSTIEKDFKDGGKSSHRPVPIHPFLVELGLLGFVRQFKPTEFIFFDGLMINKGKESDYPHQFQNKYKLSDRFTTYRRERGVGRMAGEREGDILTFHCFRNTAITKMRDSNVNPEVRCEIVGHGDGEIVANKEHKGYGDKFPIHKKLNDGIMELDFHELLPDLKLLAQSKWANGGVKKRK